MTMGAKRQADEEEADEDPVEDEEERPSKGGAKTPALVEEEETMLEEHDADPPRVDKRGRPQPADRSRAPNDEDEPDESGKQDREKRGETG